MTLRKALSDFARAVADEAERNPDFARKIVGALGIAESSPNERIFSAGLPAKFDERRPKNRRPPAVLDPVEVAREGEQVLRTRLKRLTLEQLRDIVADHGMDPGKLVMKWKSADRVIDRIVEISLARAQKGDAFRSE